MKTREQPLLPLERLFIKSGKIRAVRVWPGSNLYEIDVHLPTLSFEPGDQAQSIKCRILARHYTDYTPARWDVKEKSCTLYIDTSHPEAGSQ